MRILLRHVAALAFFATVSAVSSRAADQTAQKTDSASIPTIESRTAAMKKQDGFIPLYWDEAAGKIYLEIGRWDQELLYQVSLPAGVGSNPIGLDRGQMGESHVITFHRVGPKVLMMQPNYRFRALTGNAAERQAVDESFAHSIIGGFSVVAAEGDRVLIDATGFLLKDQHGVITRLRDAKQGDYSVDESRSAIYLPRTRAFPKNSEIEALLTLTSTKPGPLIDQTAPVGESVTIREHHSFVELPDAGYSPRRLDPRVGVFGIEFYDYASPFTEPIEKRWLVRHRLVKKDPAAAVSDPVQPIIYYVDPGAPEPIRSALVEGASWWNAAFEAAGFRNAFQVKVLPPDADPMDIRYNMIHWVHRSTRGWSYGGAVIDPRTGEILKGNVILGSLRIRQDFRIGNGLIPQFTLADDAKALAGVASGRDAAALALGRIRQLAAHEVGHTLGLDHNFAASSYGRASVMDYPAPWVDIRDGKLDFSNAYATGIGAYDKFAIRYAYSQFPQALDEERGLQNLLAEGDAAGMLFIKDDDARGVGTAHPLASVWDNGADAVATLEHEIEVRRIALESFGLDNLRPGAPLSTLEEELLPLYLHHRYQVEAAAKSIGGMSFTYAVRSGRTAAPSVVRKVVTPGRQREALAAVLKTLEPKFLRLPQRIIDLIPPRAFGYERGTAELFPGWTGPAFDPFAAANAAADVTLTALFERHRAARLELFHAEQSANPDFAEVAAAVVKRVFPLTEGGSGEAMDAAIRRTVQSLTIQKLEQLADDDDARADVRCVATETLRTISARSSGAADSPAFRHAQREEIQRFLARPAPVRRERKLPEVPPGPPIGADDDGW